MPWKPTEEMAAEAQRGLDWREEFGRGGTEVGVARARDISNRRMLSVETVYRMVSYFARHEVDKEGQGWSPGEDGYPSAGRIAWALWGGDVGRSWANARIAEHERSHMDIEKRHILAVEETDAGYVVTFAKGEMMDPEAPEAPEMTAPPEAPEAPEVSVEIEAPNAAEFAALLAALADPTARKAPLGQRQMRSAVLDARGVDMDKRTVELAFSSEAPVERGYGIEILDHGQGAMQMEFINSGRAPLLVDHDPTDVVGVVEQVTMGADRMARARVRFGRSVRAQEILQDVVDGIRTNVSVGYTVDEWKVEKGDRGKADTYRAVRWTPLEISSVSIPADARVGVGRALEISDAPASKEIKMSIELSNAAADAAREERSRVSSILELGTRHNQRALAEKAIHDGVALDAFRGALLDKVGTKPLEDSAAHIGMTKAEAGSYSLCRAIDAAASGDWRKAGFEREASQAVSAQLGREARGFFLPMDVQTRDLTVGTATAGGNLVGTDLLGGSFIELLRNRMVVNQLGASVLSGLRGNVAIPRQSGAATAYWVSENSPFTESNHTFNQVTMSPKFVGTFTDMSRRLVVQSDPSVEALVRSDLATVLAIAVDAAAFHGTGTNGQPTGIINQSGIGSVAIGTNGGAPTWASVVNLMREVEVDNALAGSLAYVTNPKVKAKLMTTAKQSSGVEGNFILQDPANLNGYRFEATQQISSALTKGSSSGVCSAMFFGNFAELLIGYWGGLDVLVDPYTGGAAGTLRIRTLMDCDIAVRHAESFAVVSDYTTT